LRQPLDALAARTGISREPAEEGVVPGTGTDHPVDGKIWVIKGEDMNNGSAVSPAPTSPIASIVMELHDQIMTCTEQMAGLKMKLAPVLHPEATEPDSDKASGLISSPMHVSLVKAVMDLRSLSLRIEVLRNSLDV
jgi:hypothetical protein